MRPVEVESRGLMMALRELAATAEHVHDVKCAVTISRPVFIHDNTVATNLFRIAQEAVNSAATHGEATTIQIALRESVDQVTLTVRDNGKPLSERPREGLGAHMMRYHARVIGGVLEWRVESAKGVVLACSFRKRAASR
jgi:two-component system, LuxR family, sensor kinase FixL